MNAPSIKVSEDPHLVMPFDRVLAAELESGAKMKKGDRTRLRLRIAAAQALEHSGYQDLKVTDIAERAGVALGTFYVYFVDKEDVSVGVVMDFVTHLYEEARRIAKGRGEWSAIYESNLFFIRAYQANPGLMRSHVQLQAMVVRFREVWEPLHLEWLNKLAGSIRRRADSDPGAAHALKMALALEQMVFSYIYSAAVTRESPIETDESDPADMAEVLTLLWFRSVHARDPHASERVRS